MSCYKRVCEPQNVRYVNVARDDSEIYQDKETMEILSDYIILERLNEQDKRIKELENELELYKHYVEFVPSSSGDF